MFTIVKQRETGVARSNPGQPRPELIDHREEGNNSSGRKEKIRKDDESYKHLKSQRDDLLVAENIYKRKIKELEEERKKLISIYEPTYEENKKLKSILEHGPEAVKVRKLQKAKKETEKEIEVLKVENKRLVDQMKEFMQINSQAKDQLLEHNWQTVLASGKRNKGNTSIKKTSRSLPESEQKFHKKAIFDNDSENIHCDTYDLKLDTVEKEIQILLNKVKHLKSEKEQVDFAMVAKKRAITNNPLLENALREKLDKDLATFENNVEMAKKKHENLKKKMAAEKKKTDEENKGNEIIVGGSQSNVKLVSYNTSETQTDPFSDFSVQSRIFFFNNSKEFDTRYNATSRQNNKSIQTDSVSLIQQIKLDSSSFSFATNKSPSKDQQTTQKIPIASSRKIMNEYASRLLIKQDVSKTKTEEQSTGQIHKEELHKSPTHTENNKQYETKQQKTSRSEKKLYEQSVLRDQTKQERSEDTATRKAASETQSPNAKQHFLPHITDKSLSKTNPNKSRVKAKSVGHEDIGVMEYINKIIEQRLDSLCIQLSQNGNKHNPDFRKTKTTSQSLLDVSICNKPNSENEELTKIKSKHKVKPQILTKNDRYSWKSESEIIDVRNIKPPTTHFRDFNCIVPHRKAFIRYKGELQHYDNQVMQAEHRDERAYDEVLADLEYQQRNPNRVNTEFNETAETYRQHKTAIREEQNHPQQRLISKNADGFQEMMPLKFSSNARDVDSRKIKLFLNRR